jgi:hypothetical protein
MPPSLTSVLVFVMRHSGVVGELRSGRIERNSDAGLNVFTGPIGELNDYILGTNLRSWCVLGIDGKPLPGWHSIEAEDYSRMFSR